MRRKTECAIIHAAGLNEPLLTEIAGRPLLYAQINCLKRNGIKEICLMLDTGVGPLKSRFEQGEWLGVRLKYYSPAETGGLIKDLKSNVKGNILFLSGGLFFDLDISDIEKFHEENRAFLTQIVRSGGPASGPGLPFYMVRADILDSVRQEDFTLEGVFNLFKEKLSIYKSAEYIRRINSPEDAQRAALDVLSGKVERCSRRHKRPAIFLDMDGTVLEDTGKGGASLFPFAASAIKSVNESDFLVFLISNKDPMDRNIRGVEGIERLNREAEELLGNYDAYADNIYFCPHSPVKNPSRNESCGCAPPEPGLIFRAREDFIIDLESSWIIGDSLADIQLGQRAGLRTVLVKRGLDGQINTAGTIPEFIFNDMGEAVRFILKDRYNYLYFAQQVIDRIRRENAPLPVLISVRGPALNGKRAFLNVLSKSMLREGIQSRLLPDVKSLNDKSHSASRCLIIEGPNFLEAGGLKQIKVRLIPLQGRSQPLSGDRADIVVEI
jgi:histidinol-phosphate phosphatase family protein